MNKAQSNLVDEMIEQDKVKRDWRKLAENRRWETQRGNQLSTSKARVCSLYCISGIGQKTEEEIMTQKNALLEVVCCLVQMI